MRRLTIIIVSIFISAIASWGQDTLGNLVSKKDTAKLRAFVKQWDNHFANDWILEKAKMEGIDHFENGYVLTWTRSANSIKYSRGYVFNLNSQLVSTHEQRFVNDSLLSQGGVQFKNRSIDHIRQVIINKKSLRKINFYWDYDVDGYFFEIYENGKLSCIYKTIHLNHYYMLFQKVNKDKIELIIGKDCLGIKEK